MICNNINWIKCMMWYCTSNMRNYFMSFSSSFQFESLSYLQRNCKTRKWNYIPQDYRQIEIHIHNNGCISSKAKIFSHRFFLYFILLLFIQCAISHLCTPSWDFRLSKFQQKNIRKRGRSKERWNKEWNLFLAAFCDARVLLVMSLLYIQSYMRVTGETRRGRTPSILKNSDT